MLVRLSASDRHGPPPTARSARSGHDWTSGLRGGLSADEAVRVRPDYRPEHGRTAWVRRYESVAVRRRCCSRCCFDLIFISSIMDEVSMLFPRLRYSAADAVVGSNLATLPSSLPSVSGDLLSIRPRDLWARRPEIAGGSVYRLLRCLAPCQLVSPVGPWPAAPAHALVTRRVTRKALSLVGKGLELRKLVAGAGFEPATSGL